MAPTRDDLAAAIGKILFLKLSKEQAQQLLKDAGATPDWEVVRNFTRHALSSVSAARSLSTHFAKEVAVLDAVLEPQVFLGGATPCVADLACYIALIPAMLAFTDEYKWALCNASRWFDHMQHLVEGLAPPSALKCDRRVVFNYDIPMPPPKVASLLPLIASPTDMAAAESATAMPTGAPSVGAGPSGDAATAPKADEKAEKANKAEKAEKKEKKEKKEKPAPPPAEEGQSDVSKLDIRVGLIISAERHPEADKLYVEQVDVGEDKPRTVVSGLVPYMPADALTNRRAVLLCNLKPQKMKGIESQAMVLAASDAEHTIVELLSPPAECAIGERIFFDGHPGEPLAPNVINKKKVWEAVQPELGTDAACVAQYKGVPFNTSHGACTVATIALGTIK